MKNSTLHIKNPSKELLSLVRKLGNDKDVKKTIAQKNISKYFKKA